MARATTARKTADAMPKGPAITQGAQGAPHPLMRNMTDTLVNLVTGMGTSKDKSTATMFGFSEMPKVQLEAAYRGDWVSRKVIDIPAYDATREWRTWQSDQDDLTKIEDLERDLKIQRKTMVALQRARLYGGAALILGVDQGQPQDPINFDKLGEGCLKFVHVVNRYELASGPIEWDIMSPYFGTPKYYTRSIQGAGNIITLHPSRIVRFTGLEVPDINLSPGGWGDSVLQVVADAVMALGTVTQAVASLIAEAKVDVVKIPELSERISNKEYEDRLKTRFSTAGLMKSLYSLLLIDKEEDWARVEQTFTGMPEVMQEFTILVCGAADIPATRFLGQAPKGMNATGDSDTRNYYDRVSTEQEITIKPVMNPLDDLLLISSLGKKPDGIFYDWNPLWQMDDAAKTTIAVQQSSVMTADVNAGLMDPMVLQKAREAQLIESGFYPGLEQIIDEFGTDINQRVDPNAPQPMIDPTTGAPPDPNDPEAMARAIPDPNAPAPTAVPGAKVGAPAAKPAKPNAKPAGLAAANENQSIVGKKKVAAATDNAIEDMAIRIRDAELVDASTPRTLYINRPVLNWKEIAAYYKKLGVSNVSGADMHVTVCYSKKPVDWLKVGEDSWGNDDQGNLTVKPGGPRVMEQFKTYLVLAFANSDLAWRHCSILERTDGTWDDEDYTPHVSISSDPGAVEPLTMPAWAGKIELGPEVFQEIKLDYFPKAGDEV